MKRWILMADDRRWLIAALPAAPARAIVCSNCEQEAMAVLRQIDQLRQWSSQLKAMADQLTQLKDTHQRALARHLAGRRERGARRLHSPGRAVRLERCRA